jgi:hypothetical protein
MPYTEENLEGEELSADEEPTRATEAELASNPDENNDESDVLFARTVAAVTANAVAEAYEEAVNETKKRKRV